MNGLNRSHCNGRLAAIVLLFIVQLSIAAFGLVTRVRKWSPHADIFKSRCFSLGGVQHVTPINDDWKVHVPAQLDKVSRAELIPFAQHEYDISSLRRLIGGVALGDSAG